MENVEERMKNFNKKPSKSSSNNNIKNGHSQSNQMKVQSNNLGGQGHGHPQGGQGQNQPEVVRQVSQEVNMDSVVSDLNSFLASTRAAISSPGNYYLEFEFSCQLK